MTYDDTAGTISLKTVEQVRNYVQQNESQEVKRRKCVRQMLRALEVGISCAFLTAGESCALS
jgi:hypothetical protein